MTLNFVRRGEGAQLLLIHGLGGTWQSWSTILPALSEAREVIAIDLPGHGETPAAADSSTFAGLADSVGTRPAIGSPPVAPSEELDDEDTWAKAAHDLELLEQCVHPAARAAWRGEQPPKPPTASAGGSTTAQEGSSDVAFTDEQSARRGEEQQMPEEFAQQMSSVMHDISYYDLHQPWFASKS